MDRDEDIITNKGGPLLDKVRKWNQPVDPKRPGVLPHLEAKTGLGQVLEKSLVERPVVVHGDLGVELEDGQKRRKRIRGRVSLRLLRPPHFDKVIEHHVNSDAAAHVDGVL